MKTNKAKLVTVLSLCVGLLSPVAAPISQVAHAGAAENTLASDRAYAWLKAQQDLTTGHALSGLVDSFDDWWNATDRKQIVYTYDQAVAAIAFMVKGDRARAEQVLNKMVAIQDPDGSWINSYWWNGYGEEIRKHVGPVAWMAMAFMTHEKLYGGTTYRAPAKKAMDWMVQFKKPNGAISGGKTTWDANGAWTDEVWSSTEHNQDVYNILKYYANVFPDRTTTYNDAANGVKSFLDNVVWDDSKKRWRGGWKNNTNLIDPAVPLDVNPWGVLALGLTGTRSYKDSLAYVDNANGSGTVDSPKYVHSLTYDGSGQLLTAYDFDWQYDCANAYDQNGNPIGQKCADVWFEGSAFMSLAHYMNGNTAKADSIITEIMKKQGTSGSLYGGVPYSLKGSNNSYWRMAMENCVSSTGWLIIAAHRFNPFTGSYLTGGGGGGGTTPPPTTANTLYLRDGASSTVQGTLSATAGSSANTDTIASAGGGNYDGTVRNANVYVISGLNGTYDSTKSTQFNLFIDSGSAIANGLQAKVSYDFNGDNVYDRAETFNYFATDDVTGWQNYSQGSGLKSSSGSFANLSNGKVKVEIWSAIGNANSTVRTDATSTQGSQSKLVIPYK
ncbi:hypothetical protein [Brevibacillus dissolubilis]|uniref:hypothetical protein n=1 Tax=Brevibacillus dissolubilis TaxID=1844116 RepID=UPI00111755EA|nr:hypothetical protein [Brevibacillus dissolubilis]